MDEERIKTAAWDLVSEDRDRRGRGYKYIKELGGAAAGVVLQAAREWNEKQQSLWLGCYAGGSPTYFLAHAIGDSQGIEVLAAALNDENPRFRGFATFALVEIDDPRVHDMLFRAFRDEDADVRRNAICGLQRFGDQQTFDLVAAAMHYFHEGVRSAAARALKRIGGADGVAHLIQALDDPSDRVVLSAVTSLGVLGVASATEPLVAVLQSDRAGMGGIAADALGKIGDPRSVAPLLNVMTTASDYDLRSFAWRALAKLHATSAIEPLISMLNDSDARLRNGIVNILGSFRDARSADALTEALHDEDAKVRRSATFALASIGDKRAVDPLISMLLIEPQIEAARVAVNPDLYEDVDRNRFIRESAARALGKLGDARAIAPLAGALEDSTAGRAAALSLALLGDDRGLQHLLVCLSSAELRYQSDVVRDLGETTDPRAVKPLVDMLDPASDAQSLQGSVLCALGRIGTNEAVRAISTVLMGGGEHALDAATELAKLGDEAGFEYLSSELTSGDLQRRMRVVRKTCYISDERVVPILIGALRDESAPIRVIAAHALGKSGGQRVAETLKVALADQDRKVQTAAFIALNRLARLT